MAKAWTDKTEYKILSGQLASSSRYDFERAVLPFIGIIWADTFAPKMLGSYDRIGIDLLVWADREPFALVVQCKGFETSEEEIGQEQINQCLKSIASFEKSGKRAQTYLFVHNRLGRHAGLRSAIETGLDKLKKSGQVKHVALWDRQMVLRHAFNKIHERVRQFVTAKASIAELDGKAFEFEPLHHVPLQVSELAVSPYRLEKASPPRITITDPCSELLRFAERNLNLMIGEAGCGKTTAALRTFQSDRQIFYVPGSTFSANDASTKGFLQQCVNLDKFLSYYQDRDILTVKEMLSAVIPQILKERNTPLVLVIDGLDESIFFSYRGGLQWLFNHLRDVLVPVVLVARMGPDENSSRCSEPNEVGFCRTGATRVQRRIGRRNN